MNALSKRALTSTAALVALAVAFPSPVEAAKRKTKKKATRIEEVKVEEVGVLKNEDVHVVQKMMYAKRGHPEIGFLLSAQPWDAYTFGAMGGFDLTLNATENFGVEVIVQGGYGWANGHHKDVTYLANSAGGAMTALANDAVRQLVGGNVNLVWSPIYAKLAWGSQKVVHFDVYGTLGAHGFLTQRLESEDLAALVGPSVGLGLKFFLSPKAALKIDLRDNISLETRQFTGRFTARNNFQFGLGLAFYPTVK